MTDWLMRPMEGRLGDPGRIRGGAPSDGTRDELLSFLAIEIGCIALAHPTRVAVDGPPGAGKTMLADELAALLQAKGRDVILATIDDFLFPQSLRHRRGRYSAEGCYFDTHDYVTLKRVLLDPLGPDGNRQFRKTIYDAATDSSLVSPAMSAPTNAVLIFDGVFLLRPELNAHWDMRILVTTTFETIMERALIRERNSLPANEVERRWRGRYIPAQQLYFDTVRPAQHAEVVVHNDVPQHPSWQVRER